MKLRNCMFGLAIIFLEAIASQAATQTALVIGNSGYQNSPLTSPVNDAIE